MSLFLFLQAIPGPYKLSLFLLCAKKDGTFDNNPVRTSMIRSRATDILIFPPIELITDIPTKYVQSKTIGKWMKDKFGRSSNQENDLEIGTSITEVLFVCALIIIITNISQVTIY